METLSIDLSAITSHTWTQHIRVATYTLCTHALPSATCPRVQVTKSLKGRGRKLSFHFTQSLCFVDDKKKRLRERKSFV